jgi:hypothetical protein
MATVLYSTKKYRSKDCHQTNVQGSTLNGASATSTVISHDLHVWIISGREVKSTLTSDVMMFARCYTPIHTPKFTLLASFPHKIKKLDLVGDQELLYDVAVFAFIRQRIQFSKVHPVLDIGIAEGRELRIRNLEWP